MSAIRGLAVRISAVVVRLASPGCKEWAQGLAAEVEFVEGDWSALGWALGSLRVLLRYREKPAGSLDDVLVAARKLVASLRIGYWLGPIWFLSGAMQLSSCFGAIGGLQRVGHCLLALGYMAFSSVFFIQWRQRSSVPSDDDDAALLQFYKARLEQSKGFPKDAKSWLAICSGVFICLGALLERRGGRFAHAEMLAAMLVGGLIGLHMHRVGMRRLARLKVLLGERT